MLRNKNKAEEEEERRHTVKQSSMKKRDRQRESALIDTLPDKPIMDFIFYVRIIHDIEKPSLQ